MTLSDMTYKMGCRTPVILIDGTKVFKYYPMEFNTDCREINNRLNREVEYFEVVNGYLKITLNELNNEFIVDDDDEFYLG